MQRDAYNTILMVYFWKMRFWNIRNYIWLNSA